MAPTKKIGFVFIQGMADWEFGFLAAAAKDWFDTQPVALTPGGEPVVSIGGFTVNGQRGLDREAGGDLDGSP